MIRTDEFIKQLDCPVCNRKGLRIWGSNGGEGNTEVLLLCNKCGAFIISNLIPNINDWIVEKPKEEETIKKEVKLWNQA